ncbi:hypothetical protein DYH09_20750 [bacterium CPR1]|nr:hypothetical protein [bacterium CPR1]
MEYPKLAAPAAPTPAGAVAPAPAGQVQSDPVGAPLLRAPLSGEERLLRTVTSDQIYHALKDTRDGATVRQLQAARTFSEQQRGIRKSAVFSKLGKGKNMHRINVLLQKSFKDMMGAMKDLRQAAQMKRTGPDYLLSSMNRMLIATQSYMGLLRPLVPLMQETNSLNAQIAGSMLAERTELGTAAALSGIGREDLPHELTSRSLLVQSQESTVSTRDGMEVGKFYFAWTRESLSDGLSLINDVVDTMRSALKKGREYLPDEASEGFEKRLARLEAQSTRVKKRLGGGGKDESAAVLTEREKLEKGRGLKMNAEEGAVARIADERSRMQEGLWAALSADSFSF